MTLTRSKAISLLDPFQSKLFNLVLGSYIACSERYWQLLLDSMNRVVLFCLTLQILLFGCKQDIDYRIETVLLSDSLTQIHIPVPVEFDSFYVWAATSDAECEKEWKYRFSDSRFPQFKESGFVVTPPDSSYRLTISHKYYLNDCSWYGRTHKPEHLEEDHENWHLKSSSYKEEGFTFFDYGSYLTKIDDIDCHITKFRSDENQQNLSSIVHANLRVNEIDIRIEFECSKSNCEGFIERMENLVKQIEFSFTA